MFWRFKLTKIFFFPDIFVVQSVGFNLCNVLHSLLSQWICWQTVSGSLHWNARCKPRVLPLRWQGNGSGPGIMRRAGSQPAALTGSRWRAGRKNPWDAGTGSGSFPLFFNVSIVLEWRWEGRKCRLKSRMKQCAAIGSTLLFFIKSLDIILVWWDWIHYISVRPSCSNA